MAVSAGNRKRIELTYRGIILGALITFVFTAANVYLGLKVGLTFATSLPAAVISMAVLRLFRNATIWENNIVQTIASAAGTLSSIIFVLPGLVMVGWWTGFPFWQSFGICVVGGILGVMYSVPLRRAMVTGSDLPYPEGVAAAEVLRVGDAAARHEGADPAAIAENKAGFTTIVWSSVVSLAFFMIIATNVFAGELKRNFRVGVNALTGIDVGLSLALIGVGHLVGMTVGIAMLAGIVLAWAILMPALSAIHPGAGADLSAMVNDVFRHRVRFIGAGAIGVAAIWSLGRLAGPVVGGVASSLRASRARGAGADGELDITERDIPFNVVTIVSVACLVPLGVLLATFLSGGVIAGAAVPLVLCAIVYIVIAGILVAAVCGYMAGLIGSSNSPVSGLAILTVLGAAVLLVALARPGDPAAAKALVAYALFVTAIVINIATISNDNLQDLKTGQLVGATPWRQQVALIFGVVFGSLVIPPLLDMINHAFGFQGSPIKGITAQPLAAPQATLISALAQGVITGDLPWNLIELGAGIGLVIVAIDELLRRTRRGQFPPLAVALGIYLPMSVTFMVVVGAFIGKYYNGWVAGKPGGDVAKRLGVLLASGFIVGESLGGVILSGIITATNKDAPLNLVGEGFEVAALWIGGIAFVLVVWAMYRWVAGLARRITA
jgi:putative OPT family oligopeptide transporter